jgi:GDP-L-fucose synthase
VRFWDNKNVVVTGGNGFLGRHVVDALNRRGVIPYTPQYDLRKTENVGRLYFENRPDIVIHLAASVGGIGANIENPGSFFYDNIKMGVELMEAGRRWNLGKFVQMGTACEYPRDAALPLTESSIWDGYPERTNASYGIAKRALLEMGQAYRKQYGMSVIHLLSTNLYGPGDNFTPTSSHVIPALIRRCYEAKQLGWDSLAIWGSGSATRDFLYVKDAAEAVVLATEKYDEAMPVNLGSGRELTIHEVATKIAYLTGFKGQLVWDKSKPDGQPRRILATNLAKEKFGFEADTLLERGLLETITWYEKSLSAR